MRIRLTKAASRIFVMLTLAGCTTALTAAPSFAADTWVLQKTDATAAAAKASGLADAAKSGPAVAAPQGKTIGLILLSMQSPANFRIATAAQRLADKLGYKLIVCDPDFDPQRVAQCATSIVAQKPDAILSDAHEPAVLGSALRDASDMGIPWFALVVDVSASPYLMQYGITGNEVGATYDAWLFDAIAKRKGEGVPITIMALGAPALGAALLTQQDRLAADVAARPNAKVVVQHDLDLPNVVQDTLNTTRQTLGQFPDLGGTWTVCDFCIPLIAQVFDAEGLSGKNRPVVGGNYLSDQTAHLMRASKIDGVVDIAFESSVYVIYDQLLEKWSRDRAINTNEDVFSTAYAMKFMQPYMVTPENVGPDGTLPILGADYEDYFMAKWGAEFGVKP